ncbi:MAG: serine O-acetyltransferase EpsC [Cytophagaceae bacterium]
MNKDFIEHLFLKHQETPRLPSTSSISRLITRILLILFPEQSKTKYQTYDDMLTTLLAREKELKDILESMEEHLSEKAEVLAKNFMITLPGIYEDLMKDIEAILQGDPAAQTEYEIIRAYPGFYAIAFYRLAHALHKLQIPLLPRVLTEFAHSKTGIDIHPAAEIQPYFFIDHGTGIVIGETAKIGKHVKLYQGVTLGALSVSKDMAETKRHPTIEDNVVIYSGATILGGNTVVGHDSIIGGNVWLINSVPPCSRVYHQSQVKVTQEK